METNFQQKPKSSVSRIKANNDLVNTPQNSAYKIYLPTTHQESYTFKKSCYVVEYLDHIITKEKWNKIVENADIYMWKASKKIKQNNEIRLPKCMIILAVIAVMLIVSFLITLILHSVYKDNSYLFYISIICIIAGTILSFGLSTFNFTRKIGNFNSIDEIIDKEMNEYFREINQIYQNKLNFVYITHKKWVECNILFQKKQNHFRNCDLSVRKSNGAYE